MFPSRHRDNWAQHAQLVRLRFFRSLVIAALVLLGLCALTLSWRDGPSSETGAGQESVEGPAELARDVADVREQGRDHQALGLPAEPQTPPFTLAKPADDPPSTAGSKDKASASGKRATKAAAQRRHRPQARRNPPDASQEWSATDLSAIAETVRCVSMHLADRQRHMADLGCRLLTGAVRCASQHRDDAASERVAVPINTAEIHTVLDSVAVVTPSSTKAPLAAPVRVVLLNPHQTGVEIGYLVNGRPHKLAPGEAQDLHGTEKGWLIQFHRGGDWGEAHHFVTQGTHFFAGSDHGWVLLEANAPQSTP